MKYVESYFVEYYDSGIILLLFNTKHKWMDYHCKNSHWYRIGLNSDGFEDESIQCKISKEELKFVENRRYLRTECQEKDQISFYFIPFDLITREHVVNSIHSEIQT